MQDMITVEHLVKDYGEVHAVRDISFNVKKGELFAFLGLNGAGKSTTINILSTVLPKTSGKVTVDGLDLDREKDVIKRRIGIVFQGSVLDDRLTVGDNLTVRASFYGLRGKALKARVAEVTELFGLRDILSRPYGKLSGGQRRRADVARGLIHRPSILFLDEPTTGLDPQTRRRVWDVLHSLRKETGMTLFLTTHYMEEAADADTVVIMDDGIIVARGTPHELKTLYSGDYVKLYRPRDTETDALLGRMGAEFDYEGECYRVRTDGTAAARDLILAHPELAEDFEVVKGNMDDVFLRVTGKKLSGEHNYE